MALFDDGLEGLPPGKIALFVATWIERATQSSRERRLVKCPPSCIEQKLPEGVAAIIANSSLTANEFNRIRNLALVQGALLFRVQTREERDERVSLLFEGQWDSASRAQSIQLARKAVVELGGAVPDTEEEQEPEQPTAKAQEETRAEDNPIHLKILGVGYAANIRSHFEELGGVLVEFRSPEEVMATALAPDLTHAFVSRSLPNALDIWQRLRDNPRDPNDDELVIYVVDEEDMVSPLSRLLAAGGVSPEAIQPAHKKLVRKRLGPRRVAAHWEQKRARGVSTASSNSALAAHIFSYGPSTVDDPDEAAGYLEALFREDQKRSDSGRAYKRERIKEELDRITSSMRMIADQPGWRVGKKRPGQALKPEDGNGTSPQKRHKVDLVRPDRNIGERSAHSWIKTIGGIDLDGSLSMQSQQLSLKVSQIPPYQNISPSAFYSCLRKLRQQRNKKAWKAKGLSGGKHTEPDGEPDEAELPGGDDLPGEPHSES